MFNVEKLVQKAVRQSKSTKSCLVEALSVIFRSIDRGTPNPTEYSFYIWIRNNPESAHWADRKRFLEFVKTVCAFNAKKWKDPNYLEKRILKEKPGFNQERLRELLIVYKYLIDFHKTAPLPRSWRFEKVKVEDGNYLEQGIKDGKFYNKELPIKE